MGDMSKAQQEVIDILFGDAIEKMNPDGADLSVPGNSDRKKRKLTAGLSAVGGGAGALGLAYSGKKLLSDTKKLGSFKAAVKGDKFAAALFPAEVAGLGGEVMSTKILHNDTKPKPPPKLKPVKVKQTPVMKNFNVKWEGEFSKVNTDKQQVFGWASIVELNGEPVVDLQGDYIAIDEVEKAGYEYVVKSRKGGDMHLRDGENPIHASDMIESFIVTPEKKKALGLPDDMPIGWWVGYQVNDPDVWAKVKSGERTGFSIHGRGVRKDA